MSREIRDRQAFLGYLERGSGRASQHRMATPFRESLIGPQYESKIPATFQPKGLQEAI